MSNFLRKHWLIILIILLSALTRFYRLPATVTFLEDEGRDVLIERRLLTGNLVALGPQTSTGNMYLGPFYYYFAAPALLLSGGDPLGPIILIAISGVITTYLLYLFSSAWFGQKVGYLAAFLFAVLPATVYMNRNSWNPNLVPLVSLLFVQVLTLLTPKRALLKHFFFLGLLAGILVQLHYMVLVMLGVSGLYLIYQFRRDLTTLIKGTAVALLGFILLLLPFIMFEFKNDFVNTQAIYKFIEAKEEHNIRYQLPFRMYVDKVVESGERLLSSLFGKGQVTTLDPFAPFFFWGFLILVLLAFKQSSKIFKLLSILTLGSLAVLGIYQENIHLHYLGFLFPLTLILLASLIRDKRFWVRLMAVGYLSFGLIYGGIQTYQYIQSGPSSQLIRAKEVADYIVDKAGGEPYNAIPFRDTATTTPFAYFLEISDNPPTEKLEEKLFLICVDRPCDQTDLDFDWIFRKGPAHPSLEEYLGHPFMDNYTEQLVFESMEHVSHGVWVGEVSVKLSI